MNLMRSQGFTLLEVLLALSVFALSFGLILETLGGASRNVRVAGDLGKVALLAQNRMDVIGIDTPIKVGVTQGKLDDTYSYVLTIRPYQPEDTSVPESVLLKLYHVDLAVSWGNGQNKRTEHFSTLRSAQVLRR